MEHDDEVRHEYHQYFGRQGYDTLGAETAQLCIESVERFRPDAIVLEPEFFSEKDVADLARCLLCCSVPVVVVTRKCAIPREESALPVTAHFVKPVSMSQLKAIVQNAAQIGNVAKAVG